MRKKNKVVKYRAKIPDINFYMIYSLIMNGITFHNLISLMVTERFDMSLMDVMTTYYNGRKY